MLYFFLTTMSAHKVLQSDTIGGSQITKISLIAIIV